MSQHANRRTNLTAAATFAALTIGGVASAAPIETEFRQGGGPTGDYEHQAAFIMEGAADTNHGAPEATDSDILRTGFFTWGSRRNMRSVVSFDLAGHLPEGHDTITGLSLTMTSTGGFGDQDMGEGRLYELTPGGQVDNLMVESEVTWNDWADGSAWNTAGGDLGTLLSTAANVQRHSGDMSTFGSTGDFVSAAQAALEAGRPLQMIAIIPGVEDGDEHHMVNWGSNYNDDSSVRPLLSVTTIPEPGTVGLVLAGLGAMLLRRGRQSAG